MLTVKRSADGLYHLSVPYLHPEPPSSAVLHLCKVSMEVLHLTYLRAATLPLPLSSPGKAWH